MTKYTGPATADVPNGQPIEKLVKPNAYDGTLEVHSIFYTIQGEGPFCGYPAVFVRLAGCNLQCPWCDTEYTTKRQRMRPDEIIAEVAKLAPRKTLVVITGGEPFRQQIGDLLADLVFHRHPVQVETNGTLPPANLPEMFYNRDPRQLYGVYVVCSPKTGVINESIHAVACCYKYVMDAVSMDETDGLPIRALGHVANPRLGRPNSFYNVPIYLQPADHQDPVVNERNLRAVVASAMKHGYVVQLQMHKYLNVE